MKLKDAMANLKNLTDHELLALRKQTSSMSWSFKKAGALTLIQAEIERRVATRNPKQYAEAWAVCAALGCALGLGADAVIEEII